ncbi:transposase [Kitasatospora sp. NPDC091276]|uniref:IS110 family transposase n=1 Tax=Kitasatospora sp. NPDC091276 TaxID=3155300 RepID=UPI00342063AF
MAERRARVWVGIDAGKGHHWAAAVGESGFQVWSRKIDNDEAKTDARDAFVIAETSRLRRDFAAVDVPAQLVADLALLVAHRTDLVADRVRVVNRLRDMLTGIFPALERAFDWSNNKGALTLLTHRQTPAGIRRLGRTRTESWLRKRGVRSADKVADLAVEAAGAQRTVLPGETIAASIIVDLAAQLLVLDDRIRSLDKQIRETFHAHPQAHIIESMPGIGPVPVPRDSGGRTGNLHRPKRYSRRLRRVFHRSAQTSMIKDGPNRDFYLKKRAEGCGHVQALIALAGRRVNVLWALLCDGREFTPVQPVAETAA